MINQDFEQGEKRAPLGSAILERIESFQFRLEPVSVGTVVEVGDGIVRLSGLRHVMMGEMVHFDGNVLGMVLNLEADNVGVIVLGDHSTIREESTVEATGRVMSVPVGNELIGRVVDPIGAPMDERGAIASSHYRPVERVAPGIIHRQAIDTPLQTGIKAVDALVPIGRGQRELIVGDRQTGKTTLAIDTILNQHRDDVLCIYVAIGQKLSSVVQVVQLLRNEGAMDHTVVVAAEASSPVALQYIAPYTGCAIAEEFMEQGRDVLIIYDDLTKHAWAYRQISLLLRHPPGREAYPGDIFYLHSRLLERAGRLSEERGGGSMTALPIIETQMGDLAAYIPTNVISITDGQIYLEAELFHSGVRPAVNAGLSVSRVAGAAQYPIVRSVAGQMRLELAQYRELAAFARFGTELDRSTQRSLDRGARLLEMLKQRPHQPVAVEDQVVLFYAATNGYLDEVPVDAVDRFERQLVRYLHERRQGLRNAIAIRRELSPSLEQMLQETIREFLEQEFDAEREA